MIAFPCPKCRATLKAPEGKAGARNKCPRCGCPVQVPGRPDSTLPAIADVLPVEAPGPGQRTAVRGEEILDVLPADDVSSFEEVEAPRQKRRVSRRIIAVGQDGEVELLKNSVVIRRKGFWSFALHGGIGDKEILLAFITGVEFQDVGVNVSGLDVLSGLAKNRPGYIRFLHTGSTQVNQAGLSFTDRARGQLHDENRVSFGRNSREAFLALKEAIEERINEIHTR
jgi:hypothetical protein